MLGQNLVTQLCLWLAFYLHAFGAVLTMAYSVELHRPSELHIVKRDRDTNTRHRRLQDGSFEVVPLNAGIG